MTARARIGATTDSAGTFEFLVDAGAVGAARRRSHSSRPIHGLQVEHTVTEEVYGR